MNSRTQKQIDALPLEKQAAVKAIIAKTQTPEYRAKEIAQREAILNESKLNDKP